MIWEPFLREYVTGNIYNVPKGEFLLYRSGSFLLKSDTDRTKSFTDSYPDLSAKLYMIGLNFPLTPRWLNFRDTALAALPLSS